MPGIDWEKGSSKDQLSDKFYECTLDLFLKQNVTKTTRNKFGQTSNLLDLILTIDEYLVNDVLHMAPLGKSDHDVIAFNMNLSIRKIYRSDTILYSKGDYANFRSYISTYDWSILNDKSVEESWILIIRDTLLSGISQFIPTCNINYAHKAIWLNKAAMKAIKKNIKHIKSTLPARQSSI